MISEAVLTSMIAPVVTTWLSPKINVLATKLKVRKSIVEHSLELKFTEYLERTYLKNSYMNTIIFRNSPQKIEELYIPLTLETKEESPDILINQDISHLLNEFDKILITDAAGMGKSTLLKWMYRKNIELNLSIPVFLELRKLSKENTIIDELFKELNPVNNEFDKEFILELIHRGDFTFYLDGYDEIPLENRIEVTEDLQSFISKASNNKFILSSRPNSAIISFADFYEFNIKPLTQEEAFNLLEKYDKNNGLSKQIIKLLNGDTHGDSLKEFLINPLMVSLLYKGYEYKQTISYKKSIFYRQVFDALYEDHDLTKGGAYVHQKHSGLDIEEFHAILRVMAFITIKIGKVEYAKDEIIRYLTQAKEHTKIEFKESQFLKDLVSSVPLFYEEGNLFRWKHKSLQEYFTALYICTDAKNNQETILRNMYKSKNFEEYYNILDLCYDVDYKSFEKSIIFIFAEEAKKHLESFESLTPDIPKYFLEKRMHYTFGKLIFLVPFKKFYESSNRKEDFNENVSTEEFSKMVEEWMPFIEKNYKKILTDYNDRLAFLSNNSKYIVICYEKNNYSILKLLASKNFKYVSYSDSTKDVTQSIMDMNYLFYQIEEEIVLLNNEKSFVFNQPENYELVSDHIEIGNAKSLKINFEEVSNLYQRLVREKNNGESEDFYLF